MRDENTYAIGHANSQWDDVFFVNETNRAYLREGAPPPMLEQLNRRMVFGLAGMLFGVVLPTACMVTLLFGISAPSVNRVMVFVLVAGVMLFIVVRMFSKGFSVMQRLKRDGKIAVGEITQIDTEPVKGKPKGARAHVRFKDATGEPIEVIKRISDAADKLRDGRPLPDVGLKVAVLYADASLHVIL